LNGAPAKTWTPFGILRRFRALVRRPSDLALSLRIGLFLWKTPRQLERGGLPSLLDRIRTQPRPPAGAGGIDAAVERIARLRRPWFGLPALRGHDTCYMRALTLYRFLDPGTRDLRIHFVVEPAAGQGHRLRGHAWVSLDGRVLEEPEELVREGRTRGLYTHPAAD
jgi:hypothetical protein